MTCRLCGSSDLKTFLNLGAQPLANRFVAQAEVNEPRYHLAVQLCQSCFLAQLSDAVSTDLLYSNYLSVSSTSSSMIQHLDDLAQDIVTEEAIPEGSLAVDIGCGDGVLLESFRHRRLTAIGVEPARNLAREVRARGFDIYEGYFGPEAAAQIKAASGTGFARLITATNVLSRAEDLHAFVASVASLMNEESVFVAEMPYLPRMIEATAFDMIDHEQVSYLMLTPIGRLMRQHGLSVTKAKFVNVHGGSLRITVKKAGARVDKSILDLLASEAQHWMSFQPYADFARKTSEQILELRKTVRDFKVRGKSVGAYGASAKAAMRLSAVGLTADDISFVAEANAVKHGRLMPGTKIPIVAESEIMTRNPDYVLLLAWTHKDEVLERNKDYKGKFIIPVPKITIVQS